MNWTGHTTAGRPQSGCNQNVLDRQPLQYLFYEIHSCSLQFTEAEAWLPRLISKIAALRLVSASL